ncbi:argininosuccinate lyase [Coemansia sp. RSA 2523]|nr:argininosuccinate lyase [Coemansia sp. RSA 1824]KAJ1785451.1 argininosuccinate lyase [Coemansia sp. RSA 2167]KAJ1810691.1 argininosuccinate lyase [Coemansia sp. RSA 2523]KAJ2133459.1 argininosuccinate lyase [Coemansia sp. RSA 921]KAJ2141253.1 argininosuccinate lyase [Coemansia sp. RSA 564]KAJ2142069.1 argininosuccinate lyase [Coemansia sp. RSA 637]KAJ2165229.1 argininosuccinate lyase [Coemansia sp. RSA 562]KAJ2170977.1 argininosuccinate lyase [Coemansia sp. RSA 560]KAJ2181156.1 argininos
MSGAKKLWGGRFTGATDPLMEAFNESIHFDRRMFAADIRGSQAYAKALLKQGILTADEQQTLDSGLQAVQKEWEANTFELKSGDEDIHTANERRLGELVGSVAGKLHTGRSRNDQVATDMRLWLRTEVERLHGYLRSLVGALVERASSDIDVLMPGYTHLQRAQPIRWSHLLLSYAFWFQQDAQRFEQFMPRVSQLPLGAGALAGNPFQVDRTWLAQELQFDSVAPNSLYATSDRDFVAEFLFHASLVMVHISRLAEDLIIYSSAEFGFVKLADAYSTGSSLMPQKKNPDSLELLRGKSGRVFGAMSGFMMTYKGLPSTYNKDMQEDKEPMFDAVDTLSGSLQITAAVVSTLKVNAERMKGSLTSDMLATDLAEYLVRKGVPFRETHHISGAAVKMAEDKSCQISDLSVRDLQTLHPLFESDVLLIWDFERSVNNRSSIGGTSRVTVQAQIDQLTQWLN